jgi:hypothetical protein
MLFIIALAKGNSVKTLLYDLSEGVAGIHCIGKAISAPFDFSEVITIQ